MNGWFGTSDLSYWGLCSCQGREESVVAFRVWGLHLPPPALTGMLGSGRPRESPAHHPRVHPASRISGQRSGKSHHWEENHKKAWSACSATPWGPESPHPQKSPLRCSQRDSSAVTVPFSESCVAIGYVSKDTTIPAAATKSVQKTPTEIRFTLWRTCEASPVVLFPAGSWESASTGQSDTKACKSLNSSLHQMWWIQVDVQEA